MALNYIFKNAKGDRYIWLVVIFLSLFSLLAVYSSTGTLAYKKQDGNTEYYIFKHITLMIAGLFLMYWAHKLDYRYYSKIAQILLFVSFPLLAYTILMGDKINQAARWITIPIIDQSFQTSDLAKLAIIMYLARELSRRQENIKDLKTSFLPIIGAVVLTIALIAPANFSTALMLFLTYTTINYKTYDKSLIDIGQLDLDADLDEEIPLIDQIKPPPPPPPPPAAPEVIDIVEDEEEIEETVIESTETDQDEEIEVEDIVVEEVYEDVEVPFSVIENVPEYPGCEKGSNADKRKCMSDKIAKFVQRKFNTDLAGDLGLSGKQRINVIFKIDKKGNVTGVRSRAPHPRLEKEAARVINMLPKMKPGRQRGKAVVVPYSLPITFQVQD